MFIIVPLIWIIWINCSEYTHRRTDSLRAMSFINIFHMPVCSVLCHFALHAICSMHYTHAHAHIIFESNASFTLPVAMIRSYLASAWLDSFPWNHTRAAGIRLIRQVNSQYFCSISILCALCVYWWRVRNAKKNPIENVLAKSMFVQANRAQTYKQAERRKISRSQNFGNEINDNREWHATFESSGNNKTSAAALARTGKKEERHNPKNKHATHTSD